MEARVRQALVLGSVKGNVPRAFQAMKWWLILRRCIYLVLFYLGARVGDSEHPREFHGSEKP